MTDDPTDAAFWLDVDRLVDEKLRERDRERPHAEVDRAWLAGKRKPSETEGNL